MLQKWTEDAIDEKDCGGASLKSRLIITSRCRLQCDNASLTRHLSLLHYVACACVGCTKIPKLQTVR